MDRIALENFLRSVEFSEIWQVFKPYVANLILQEARDNWSFRNQLLDALRPDLIEAFKEDLIEISTQHTTDKVWARIQARMFHLPDNAFDETAKEDEG